MSKFISLTGLSEFLTKCRALFYTKPSGGIPSSDLASAVQTSLGKADSAYQKPNSGIPKTDLASGVQSSLELADSSVQANPVGSVTPAVDPYDYATREEFSQLGQEVTDLDGTFDRVDIPGSDNLLDGATIEDSCYYWQGARNASNSYCASDFIPVTPGEVITLQAGAGSDATLATNRSAVSMRFVDAYDSSKQSVSASSQANTSAYTVPNGVAYIRISTSQFKPFGYFYPCVFANVSEIRDYEQYAPISYKLILKAENNNDEHINTLVDEKTLPIAEDVEELREDVNEILSGYGSETISGDDSILLNDVAPTSQNVLVSLETRNLNLLPYTCGDGSLNGITYQVRQDGSIALWGTATANTQLDIRGNASKVSFPAGTYTISVRSNKPFGSNIRFFANGITGSFAYENTPRTETIGSDVESTITLSIITPFSATQEDPVIVYLMVESGSRETDYQSPKTKDMGDLEPYFPTIALSVNHNGDITTASISSGAGNIPINADGGNLSISTPIPLVVTATALVIKEEKNGLGIALSASVGVTPIIKRDANFSANDKISLLYTNTKKNKVLSFFGKISTFGELTINHGPGVYAGGVITIDATKIIVKVYYSGYTEYLNEAHGLTFSDYVGVIVSINEVGLLRVFIYTNGGSYTKDRVAWSGRGVVEIENTGNSSFTDVVATWNCNDFKKPVWVFGDSYIGYSDPARWPKYVVDWGGDNMLLSGFGGEGAADGITDFTEAINHGTPKIALWLLGMNNGDTGGAINATWLSGVQSFISKCNELGVEPILATIPNTPNIEHTYKNAWVVASGLRYIDFASAVGASTYPSSWNSGMLSNDNVHPSVQGAITLAMASASAVPELLQK